MQPWGCAGPAPCTRSPSLRSGPQGLAPQGCRLPTAHGRQLAYLPAAPAVMGPLPPSLLPFPPAGSRSNRYGRRH